MLQFVDLQTRTKVSSNRFEPRLVHLSHSDKTNAITLSGGLEHNTELLIDQEFIDGLQKLCDQQKRIRGNEN